MQLQKDKKTYIIDVIRSDKMKKKPLIIIITVVLVIAIIVGIAIALSKNGRDENGLILPEAKNDKIETKLPDDANDKNGEIEKKANASYDEFMEIYDAYENETDEKKKREHLDKIQEILDSVSK